MSWFAIACLVGFFLYVLWCVWMREKGRVAVRLIISLAVLVIVVIGLIYLRQIYSVFWDALSRGVVARFIFGGVLGFGFGYLVDRKNGPDSNTPLLIGHGRSTYLSLGLALVFLAAAAPFLDDWLSRLSGFKTSIIEIQLTSISTAHKSVVVPDSRESFSDEQTLAILQGYEENIAEDIAYIKLFVLRDLKWQKKEAPSGSAEVDEQIRQYRQRLQKLEDVQQAFTNTLSPLAHCILDAMAAGLSVESAREKVRPVTDAIQQIFILERTASVNADEHVKQIDLARSNLLKLISSLPDELANYLERSTCATRDLPKLTALAKEIPPYTQAKYADLPQLYVATASLLLFVNADDVALKLLGEANPDPKFHDYTLPYLYSKILYFIGEPVDIYKPFLDQMLTTAKETLDLIETVKNRCPSRVCNSETETAYRKLRRRAQRTQLIAMNNIAYGIAQDVAGRVESAEALEPIAQEYAAKLDDAVKKGEVPDETERDGVNDTIAFVTLISEGQKTIRDKAKIDAVIAALKLIIAHQEQILAKKQLKNSVIDKDERQTLNTARVHLSSAEELEEE